MKRAFRGVGASRGGAEGRGQGQDLKLTPQNIRIVILELAELKSIPEGEDLNKHKNFTQE